MKTAVIVQARVGSSRFPRKVVQDLAGKPVLAHVLERCLRVPGADVVVCAVPKETASSELEAIARDCSASTFRGPEHDVLGRYLGAARSVGADVIMRITSDCPLIDPIICGELLTLRAAKRADYASNVHPRSFPQGLDCEVFTARVLEECAATAQGPLDREHVTPWMSRARNLRRANLHSGRTNLATMRWTLDYAEDLEFFRAVFAALPRGSAARLDDVLEVLDDHQEIVAINAMRAAPVSR